MKPLATISPPPALPAPSMQHHGGAGGLFTTASIGLLICATVHSTGLGVQHHAFHIGRTQPPRRSASGVHVAVARFVLIVVAVPVALFVVVVVAVLIVLIVVVVVVFVFVLAAQGATSTRGCSGAARPAV